MLKHCSALLAVTLAAAFVSPSFSQAPSRTKVGMLGCTLSPSIGFIIGSQQSMACQFTPDGPFPPEGYLGVIDTVGLDIGFTAGGALGMGRLCADRRSATRRARR
jgi:hypothetical protein